jgi:gas vesicle protein
VNSLPSRRRKSFILVFLFLLPVILSLLVFSPSPAQAICGPGCQLRKASERGTQNIEEGLRDSTQNFEEGAKLLKEGLENIQVETTHEVKIVSDIGDQIKGVLSQVDALRDGMEGSIRQILDQLSSELQSLLLQFDQIAEKRIDQTFDRSEGFALVLNSIAEERIDDVDEKLQNYLRWVAKEVKQIGFEVQQIIQVVGEEIDSALQETGNQGVRIIQEGGNQSERVTREAGNQLRWVIRDGRDATVYIVDNISQETQEVIDTSTENLKEIIEEVSDEVQEIVKAVEDSRIQVIERGGEVILYVVDRTADVALVVISATLGLAFLFLASIGWGKAILQYPWPENYLLRGIVISFIGMTFVASFSPFVFLIPSVRAQVLIPMNLAKPFVEQLPVEVKIPVEPKVQRLKPDQIDVQSPNSEFLWVYGRNLLSHGTPIAKYGTIELPVSGQQDSLLSIELTLVHKNADLADRVEIYVQNGAEHLLSIPVTKRTPVELLPEMSKVLSSPQESASPPITKQEIENLITKWLQAKHQMFAEEYNQELAVELTTGHQYDQTNGLIYELRNNSSYYQYDSQKVLSVEDVRQNTGKASAVVIFTETSTRYINGGRVDSRFAATNEQPIHYKALFELLWVDRKWKIAKVLNSEDINRGFPKENCGDVPPANNTGHVNWHRVHIQYSENNLNAIRSRFCHNARDVRASTNGTFIQVASFTSHSRAKELLDIITRDLNTTGEIKTISLEQR